MCISVRCANPGLCMTPGDGDRGLNVYWWVQFCKQAHKHVFDIVNASCQDMSALWLRVQPSSCGVAGVDVKLQDVPVYLSHLYLVSNSVLLHEFQMFQTCVLVCYCPVWPTVTLGRFLFFFCPNFSHFNINFFFTCSISLSVSHPNGETLSWHPGGNGECNLLMYQPIVIEI